VPLTKALLQVNLIGMLYLPKKLPLLSKLRKKEALKKHPKSFEIIVRLNDVSN
jgi:hypothetical protein